MNNLHSTSIERDGCTVRVEIELSEGTVEAIEVYAAAHHTAGNQSLTEAMGEVADDLLSTIVDLGMEPVDAPRPGSTLLDSTYEYRARPAKPTVTLRGGARVESVLITSSGVSGIAPLVMDAHRLTVTDPTDVLTPGALEHRPGTYAVVYKDGSGRDIHADSLHHAWAQCGSAKHFQLITPDENAD